MLRIPGFLKSALLLLMAFSFAGCAHRDGTSPGISTALYSATNEDGSLEARFAPAFMIRGFEDHQNRIGTPTATYNTDGTERIHVDTGKPAVYWMRREFKTSKGSYINLIYRIHFPEVPLSLVPFYLTAGKNVGLLFIVTLDRQNRPLLFTTSGTCGCYAVIIPTNHLNEDAFPKTWDQDKSIDIYGETLPSLLDFHGVDIPKLVVHIRPDVHRVMDLQVVNGTSKPGPDFQNTVKMPLLKMADLTKIPAGMGRTTSFYYDNWPYKGLVKDSFKPWESLFMSLISLDFFVGTDKIYGNGEVTGTRFYTSLKPWNREASDMWHFERFLRFNGWDL